jgi:ubiquinone/menaquinone biosynthesis C-methylase UbiE
MRIEFAAELYDAVAEVTGRDLDGEAVRVREAWEAVLGRGRHRVLDVACGTGMHLERFREHADVAGVDHSAAMLRVAARRLPGVTLHEQPMEHLDVPEAFDAITCLLAGIAYPLGETRLHQALRRMRRHLRDGGVLVVDPGPSMHTLEHLQPEPLLFELTGMLIERRTRWSVHRSELVLHHEFRISTAGRRWQLHDLHEITLRDLNEHRVAMERAGFEVHLHQPDDANGPLLVGRRVGPGEPHATVPASVDKD